MLEIYQARIISPASCSKTKLCCLSGKQYAYMHLQLQSVELLVEYLHHAMLPEMVKQRVGLAPTEESHEREKC